jgi:hypothetical protein
VGRLHAALRGSNSIDAILYCTAGRAATQGVARGNAIYSPAASQFMLKKTSSEMTHSLSRAPE